MSICCKCSSLDTRVGVVGVLGDEVTHHHYCIQCYNKEKYTPDSVREKIASRHPEWLPQGIRVQEKNSGVQLVLKKGQKIVDFWPTTEVWVSRGTLDRNIGRESLVNFMVGN